jgi:hypothetical protein
MYQINKDPKFGTITIIKHLNEAKDSSIGFSLDVNNSHYRQFKLDLQNGTTLLDENNNAMTLAQITGFVATLP